MKSIKNLKIFIILLLIISSFLLVDNVYADLSDNQGIELAEFAKNMLLKSKNEHNNLIYYSQGKRLEGSREILTSDGWAFDCASFAAYVYMHTLDFKLYLNNNTLRTYLVSNFVNDANNNKNFKWVLKNVSVPDLDFNKLKPGDLVIFVGEHIMVYVGDGLIAHVSQTAPHGHEVIALKTKYPKKKASVIRVKDNYINSTTKLNTVIKWPDTGKIEDLSLDNRPVIASQINGEKVLIKIIDDKKLIGYNISSNNVIPNEWINVSSNTYQVNYLPEKNGKYYVYAKDYKNQIASYEFNYEMYDEKAPELIKIIWSNNIDKTFNIEILATDDNSISYSLDGVNYQESNKFFNLANEKYKLYLKDDKGNIVIEMIDITSDNLPNIKVNYDSKWSKEVILNIELSDKNGIKEYAITESLDEEKLWNSYSDIINYPITKNGEYYIWAKNNDDLYNYYSIKITNIDINKPIVDEVLIKYQLLGNKVIIKAHDDENNSLNYSIDNVNFQDSNEFINVSYKRNKIYVKDSVGNIETYSIKINRFNKVTIILMSGIFILLIIMIIFIKRKLKKRMI